VHDHEEVDIKVGGTVGYVLGLVLGEVISNHLFRFAIYAFKKGEFWRDGDGGYQNVSLFRLFIYLSRR
jgi:hypothetical protein